MKKIIPAMVPATFFNECVAFVEFTLETEGSHKAAYIVSTLIHDIAGTIHQERCFCPRVDGSVKALAELRARNAKAGA